MEKFTKGEWWIELFSSKRSQANNCEKSIKVYNFMMLVI